MKRIALILVTTASIAAAAPLAAQDAPVSANSAAGQKAMGNPDVVTVRNVNRIELTQGLAIIDDNGQPVGSVERLDGNDVILSDGKFEYRVPFVKIYAYNRDGADFFASRTPRSALKGHKIKRKR